MAESKKVILRRRKAVQSTQKITKAMKLVAAAKLRRAQERVLGARPYARELATILARLVAAGAGAQHPLLTARPDPVTTVLYVVISADRGLAGSYNVNLLRKAMASVRAEVRPVQVFAVGRKSREFFTRRGIQPIKEWTALGEEARLTVARDIVRSVVDLYTRGQVGEVRIVYTEFINAISQRPKEIVLLPVQRPAGQETRPVDYIYEPSAEVVMSRLVPRYVETLFFQTLLEAKASEHGARMTAMGSATDNAAELIAKLSLQFNRARQAAITKEIAEIVGGAEALK